MQRFDGRRVLVTGAASGIGRATVLRLLSEGATVVGADIETDGLAATVEHAADVAGPDRFLTRAVDVGNEDSVRDGVEFATDRLGGLDVLVNEPSESDAVRIPGMAGPDRVAGVVAMLASDDGAFISGTEVRVDGGSHM